MAVIEGLPQEAQGLRLGRITEADELILCEPVMFNKGFPAVYMTLRRASISGRVEIGGEVVNHLADVLDDEGSLIETVALDAKSYGALKNKWMRCKVDRELLEGGDG